MARQETVRLVDDLDGETEAEGTVEFDLDRRGPFAIDLNTDNTNKLREILAPYLAAARKLPNGSGRATTTGRSNNQATTAADRELSAERRTWLRENGYTVSDRGRLSTELMQAFESKTPAPDVKSSGSEGNDQPTEAATAEEEPVAEKPRRTRKKADAPEFSGANSS